MNKLAEIKGVEIARAGTWKARTGKVTITDAMIAKLEENFKKLGKIIKPCFKLGHTMDQIFTQDDGQPALGWINHVYQMGQSLFADFVDVPEGLIECIQKGFFDPLSPEFYNDVTEMSGYSEMGIEADGPALVAVSILGAEQPAIKVLEGLKAAVNRSVARKLAADDDKIIKIEFDKETKQQLTEDSAMDEKLKAMQDENAALKAKLDAFEKEKAAKVVAFSEMNDQIAKLNERIEASETSERKIKVETKLKELMSAPKHKITGAMAKQAMKSIFAEKIEERVPESVIFAQFDAIPDGTFKMSAAGRPDALDPDGIDPAVKREELVNQKKEELKKTGMSEYQALRQAMKETAKKNPQMFSEYSA